MRHVHRALLIGALTALPAIAFAQPSQNAMVAEALFEDGQKLMGAGKIAEACEKFASSQKLDPATGTLLNLAACHEKLGKTATAWLEFSEAYSQAGKQSDKQRMQFARSHMDSLEKQLYRVVIEVMKPHKNLTVKLDGADLAREALGTGIPLDPGAHEIAVSQPGKKTWKRQLTGGSGGTDRIEVPELEDQEYGFPKVEGQPDQKPDDKPLDNNPPPQDQTTGKKGSSGLLYAGIGVAGAGVAGVVVGSIFGIMTLGQASDRDKLCPPNTPCRSQAAFDADYNAKVDQTVSIIFLVGGGVAVAAGVTMIVMGLGQKKAATQTTTTGLVVSPAFAPGLAGGFVGGRF